MNDTVSRRHFLAAAALAAPGVAAALDLARPGALHALAPIARPAGTRIKTSLNAFSFIELLEANAKDASKGIDLFGLCDFCARAGFDGVDLTGYFFPGYPNAPDDAYLYKLKRHAFDLGLGISGTGVRNDFTAADRAIRAEGIARVKTWIEVAAKLGAPAVRAFAESQKPFKNWHEASGNASRDTVEGWAADALRECADHGGNFGVIVAVQNHADFITTGPEHLHLLDRVNHPWCRAVVDTGSYLTADPYADIALLAPRAANWQLKEMARPTLPSPRVDIKRVVGIVRRSGYHGYLPIETLRMGRVDYDSFTAVPKLLAELRQALDEVPEV
ncbi:MAG TPA: sugar phosphate isomerase/epimerase family protein [Gemmatimonadaceae bacterium]